MNTSLPTASEVLEMRRFLARVVRIPLASVKMTGDPEKDENTDILKSPGLKLCPVRAIEIDSILSGRIDRNEQGEPDLIRGAEMYADFLDEREPLYP